MKDIHRTPQQEKAPTLIDLDSLDDVQPPTLSPIDELNLQTINYLERLAAEPSLPIGLREHLSEVTEDMRNDLNRLEPPAARLPALPSQGKIGTQIGTQLVHAH